jgi:hypothetical protein
MPRTIAYHAEAAELALRASERKDNGCYHAVSFSCAGAPGNRHVASGSSANVGEARKKGAGALRRGEAAKVGRPL